MLCARWLGLVLLLAAAPGAQADDARAPDAVPDVVEAVAPAVAAISAEPAPSSAQSVRHLGSGVVVDRGGYLLTNAHVVAGAARVVVTLPNRPPLEARVLATAPDHDLALLRIPANTTTPLVAVRLASADDVRIGASCLALGHPLGLGSTVTRGIVSASGRRLVHDGRAMAGDFLQTDAAIHPGSSGGPLVDLQGELIGITTAVEATGHGIGFAIPIGRVRRVLAALASPLALQERWLGLELDDAPRGGGARVVAVDAGGPAEGAGLRAGDVITSAGADVVRGAFELHVRYLDLPDDAPALRLAVTGADGVRRGARLAAGPPPWTAGLRERLGLMARRPAQGAGLAVILVDAEGPAQSIGLRPGDVIVRVGPARGPGAEVEDARVLWSAVRALPSRAPLGVTVRRAGREYWGELLLR